MGRAHFVETLGAIEAEGVALRKSLGGFGRAVPLRSEFSEGAQPRGFGACGRDGFARSGCGGVPDG